MTSNFRATIRSVFDHFFTKKSLNQLNALTASANALTARADYNAQAIVELQGRLDKLEDFAALVAFAEREAVLDLVDGYAKNNTDLAEAIRARGQA